MRADKILAAEEVVTLSAIIGGDLLAQGSARSLPSPRRTLGALIFFGILSLFASIGSGPARFASAVGGVVMLGSLVLGPGGKAITHLLQSGSAFVATTPGAPVQAPPGTTAATGAPTPKPSIVAQILKGLEGAFNFGGYLGLP